MKKTLLLLSFIGLTSFSFAQTATLGIKGGINFSSLSSSAGSSSSATGFQIGVIGDFSAAKNLSIQPGVFFITKGGSAETTTSSGSFSTHQKEDVKLNYLEIPVNVLYHIPVSGGSKLFVGGGPYIGLGLSGKGKYSASATSGSSSSSTSGEADITFGSSTNDVANPDFGINFMGGIKLQNNILFSLGYGLGLANLSNDSGTTTHNRSFNLSVGYFFK